MRQRELLHQTDLRSLLPASAQRKTADGWETVASLDIAPGDILLLKTGSVVPADGVITEGIGSVDEAAFSGEHFPRLVEVGDEVAAGTLMLEGNPQVQASKTPAQSRLAALEEIHAAVHRHKKDAADHLDVLSVDTDPTRRAAG